MFSKPKSGWSTFTIGEFSKDASYITNAPTDCANAIVRTLKTEKPSIVTLDAESDGDYIVIFNNYNTYIIDSDDSLKVINVTTKQLAKELLAELKSNFPDWIWWFVCDEDNRDEIDKAEAMVKIAIEQLERILA